MIRFPRVTALCRSLFAGRESECRFNPTVLVNHGGYDDGDLWNGEQSAGSSCLGAGAPAFGAPTVSADRSAADCDRGGAVRPARSVLDHTLAPAGHVAIDGKRLRGSAIASPPGVHLLAAFSDHLPGVIRLDSRRCGMVAAV